MKILALAPFALVLCALPLAGCNNAPEQPAGQGKPAPSASENAPEGISITDARFVLPAVKGNPGAAYFTVHNDSDAARVIAGASVKGAKSAMMHDTTVSGGMSGMHEMPQATIPARGALEFKPGGKHVMAMDLDDSLQKGGTAEVTLDFGNGDKAVFPAEILAAGDAR